MPQGKIEIPIQTGSNARVTGGRSTFRDITHIQWNAFFAAFFGWALDGFDFSILSFLLIDIEHTFTVDTALAGALGTVTLMFRLVGGLSRHYQIECLDGNAIRISGHPEYCPNPVPARLHGSLDQEGVLEFGPIRRGMRLIFLLNDDCPVTTTRVLRIQVDRPGVVQPASSKSIH